MAAMTILCCVAGAAACHCAKGRCGHCTSGAGKLQRQGSVRQLKRHASDLAAAVGLQHHDLADHYRAVASPAVTPCADVVRPERLRPPSIQCGAIDLAVDCAPPSKTTPSDGGTRTAPPRDQTDLERGCCMMTPAAEDGELSPGSVVLHFETSLHRS